MSRHPGDAGLASRSRFLATLFSFTLFATAAPGATYYVDPATGSMSNPGTATQPWSTLEDIFTANKQFATGDLILLRSGYHGTPTVKGNNSGMVSIQPETGQTPKLRTLTVSAASRWDISGLDICPENSAPGAYLDTDLIYIQSSASFITVRDCLIRGALDPTGWTLANWQDRAGNGARVFGPDVTLTRNRFETVGFGIRVNKLAPRILVSRNVIHGFCMDGMQANGDDGIYEYNTITDSYVDDSNHDDFFQAWSTDATGASGTGTGTSYRVIVRGNVFISRTVPATALSTDPQGIGCFDGMYEGWTVENNLIVTNTYHGISFYGGINCRIVNNTVVENPFTVPGASRKPPWIQTFLHKDVSTGVPWPVLPSGNLIRNNISSDTAKMVSGGGTIDHNQKVPVSSFGTWFTNAAAQDFTLKPAAPGVDAGVPDLAPAIDLRELSRTAPYDLGAYEIQAEAAQTPYQQWLAANNLPADGSGAGAPEANPSGDGVSNEMKFALGLPVNSPGLDGRVSSGTMNLDGVDYLTLTYIRPEPPPGGVSYLPQVSGNLVDWSSRELVEVSSTVEGSFRRITLRDTVPADVQVPGRFVRLEVSR